MRARQLAGSLLKAGIDFLYPPACLWCKCLLPSRWTLAPGLCSTCLDRVAPEVKNRCQRCSAPIGPHLQSQKGCIHCSRDQRRYERVISLGAYEGELRRACLSCKHRYEPSLTIALVRLLVERSRPFFDEFQPDIVLPVPHHWVDRFRSSHVANTIAERLGHELGIRCRLTTLRKIRWTPKQQGLPASRRLKNVRGAFRARHSRSIAGKRVLLADDVLTTGSTADQCAAALLEAGASQVCVAVLARSIGG